jgi:hypothetical protein
MIDWKMIECAVFDWALSKFEDRNLEPTQVVWANQNIPQPAYPYLTLKRDSLVRTSAADEVRTSTDLTQEEGQEIALETYGVREFTLTINAFVDEETGSTDPNCDAMAMLSLLQVSLSQLSTQELFCLAGLAVIEELAVVDLSQVVNAEFISRAALDIRFRVTFSCIERTGYINTAQIQSVPCNPSGPCDVTGIDFEVTGN